MADHDHDAGSRGGKDAPRDPSRHDAPMSYGDLGPGPYSGPGWSTPPPPPPRPSLGDHLRRKQVQIAGAALAGLIVGGVLGGAAVAAWSRPHQMTFWDRQPSWMDRPRGEPACFEADGRIICRLEPGPPHARTG